MNNPALGGVGQARGDLQKIVDGIGDGQTAAPFHQRPERLALDKFKGDEMQPLIFPIKEDAGNVLMIEFGGRAGFLVKAEDVFRIGGHFRRQNLQRHYAVELGIAGANDGRHTADADRLDQFEVGQTSAAHISGETIVGAQRLRPVSADHGRRVVGYRIGRIEQRSRRWFRRVTRRTGSVSGRRRQRRRTFLGVSRSLGTSLGHGHGETSTGLRSPCLRSPRSRARPS